MSSSAKSPAKNTDTARATTAAAVASIRIFNTLSKNKEPLEPLAPGKIGMYLCGPTVYKPSHIGHMVGPVIFDAVKRYLVYSGYQVTWVVNITDVDDKLINESNARGMTMAALAAEMTADYHRNLAAMGVDTIDHFPKATDHMAEIIDLTSTLIDKGFAYESNGDVYFDVGRDPGYGKLSRRTLDSLLGEGGSTAELKRSAADFALWKSAKPGEPAWDSPWGKGRPGWHIECSAMGRKLLGETFDIHGGGLDLVFPHHENEIAQSECCHGKPLAKYWMHNGLMQASGEAGKVGGRNTREAAASDQQAQEAGKMGKSKGASPFSDLLKKFPGETIRFFLLATHYRSPIDYSEERIQEVGKSMEFFYRFFKRYERVTSGSFYDLHAAVNRQQGEFSPGEDATLKQVHELRRAFIEAMDDDFNTGGGIGGLFELVRLLNKYIDDIGLESSARAASADRETSLAVIRQGAATLRELTATMGLFITPVASSAADDALVNKLMQLFIQLRADSRKEKNFAMADKIRTSLAELGITLEDRPSGTEWTVK